MPSKNSQLALFDQSVSIFSEAKLSIDVNLFSRAKFFSARIVNESMLNVLVDKSDKVKENSH